MATLEEALPQTDVLYMTRIQRERFPSQDAYDQVNHSKHFVVYCNNNIPERCVVASFLLLKY